MIANAPKWEELVVSQWSCEHVGQWLTDSVNLPQYAAAFLQNGVDGMLVCGLDRDALLDVGVQSSLHQLKILAARAKQQERESADTTTATVHLKEKLAPADAAIRLQTYYRGFVARRRLAARKRRIYRMPALWSPREVTWWLCNRLMLPQYARVFANKDVDGSVVMQLDNAALMQMGLHNAIHRSRIIDGIEELKSGTLGAAGGGGGEGWGRRDSTAQHRTAQHSTAQHSTAQHSTAQQSRAE
eukprot:COSAG06_NODE_19664_length_828_cov_0.727023_1_plen_242_part_10